MDRCHRCQDPIVKEQVVAGGQLRVISDYCKPCRIDIANLEAADARRAAANRRFRSVKDLTPVA